MQILRGRDPVWADLAQRLIDQAQVFLDFTISTFSTGTDHTRRHTTTVECIGRWLLSDDFLAALSAEELFFLVATCHYHDLAMAGTEADDASPESRDQVRREHAISIGSKICQDWLALGFDDQRTAQVLGEVCRGHRPTRTDGVATWTEMNETAILGPGRSVRLRLVSALIYAIDELHIGADRAPSRVQRWRELRNEESRRHWGRHQAVYGPAPLQGGLRYEARADTPGFEESLRSQVFEKAFGAIRDLRRQAREAGVEAALPAVHVQWDRRATLELLLPLVCSDLRPRTQDEIVRAVVERLADEAGERTNLGELCVEHGSSEGEVLTAAGRFVGEAVTSAQLVPTPGHSGSFVLSTTERAADALFGRMRAADELDRLYLGRYCASWEERLFESEYGRAYVRTCVLPAVERSYSVLLTQRPPDDPIRAMLERCPTAARIVREFRPPPSNLVKEVLLRQAAFAGALFDLHANPDRILDQPLRAAVWALTRGDADTTATVRLVEEMALVGGFTSAQVVAAQEVSDALRDAIRMRGAPEPPGISFTINQQVPAAAPAATSHLPRVLLASRRSNTPIQLAAAPGHELDINVESGGATSLPSGPPTMIGVGPAVSAPTGPGHLPARIELSRSGRIVRFYLGRFVSGPEPTCLPLVVRIPPPPATGMTAGTVATFGTQIVWPNVTVRDLRCMEEAASWFRTRGTTVELLLEDGSLLARMTTNHPAQAIDLAGWQPDMIRGLRGLSGDLFAPLFVPPDRLAEFGRLSPAERQACWQQITETPQAERRTVCPLFVRLVNPEGVTVEERFVTFFTQDLFHPPRVEPGGNLSQEEVERRWASGEDDFLMTAYFEPDVFTLRQSLLEWCQDRSREFPFRFHVGPDDAPTPTTRSVISVIHGRVLDRDWHRIRPIIFEFRPVNRREAYELEASYWRSVGQDARAALAAEIVARVESGPDGVSGP